MKTLEEVKEEYCQEKLNISRINFIREGWSFTDKERDEIIERYSNEKVNTILQKVKEKLLKINQSYLNTAKECNMPEAYEKLINVAEGYKKSAEEVSSFQIKE